MKQRKPIRLKYQTQVNSVILILFLSLCSHTSYEQELHFTVQNKSDSSFVYRNKSYNGDSQFTILPNGTFYFENRNGRLINGHFFSSGRWTSLGDTLILKSQKKYFYNDVFKCELTKDPLYFKYKDICVSMVTHNDSVIFFETCTSAEEPNRETEIFMKAQNNRVDLKNVKKIRSICKGIVAKVEKLDGKQGVGIAHIEYFTSYTDLDSVFVKEGELVEESQIIGYVKTEKAHYFVNFSERI